MQRAEKRLPSPVAHVILRECDRACILSILDTMRSLGILIGKGTTSDAVRFALNHTADTWAAEHGNDRAAT